MISIRLKRMTLKTFNFFITFLLFFVGAAFANPEGGVVKSGNVSIESASPTRLNVIQSSNKAIIDWRSFSIEANEHTDFQMPSPNSVNLSRVTGDNPSNIFGKLTSNGRLMLINPNGILFGKDSQVDVNGLIATTGNIDNRNFLNGFYHFREAGNPDSAIINQGTINVADGGLLALVAPGVRNEGIINARFGSVTLASGNRYIVDLYGDGLINLMVPNSWNMSHKMPVARSVENVGEINARGGTVVMDVRSAQNVLDNVVNMSGVINANSFFSQKGKIILNGDANTKANVTGTLNASGNGINEKGGEVNVFGGKISIVDNALIDVSSNNKGGKAFVGSRTYGIRQPHGGRSSHTYLASGATIDASSYEAGPGGEVSVWGEKSSRILGTIKARGGSFDGVGGKVTTAGPKRLIVAKAPDVSSDSGKAGSWEIISDYVEIVDKQKSNYGSPDVSAFDHPKTATKLAVDLLESSLNTGSRVKISKGLLRNREPGGKITVNAPVSISGGGRLELETSGDVQINKDIILERIGSQTPAFTVSADEDGNGEGVFNIDKKASINSFKGYISIYASDVNIEGTIENDFGNTSFSNNTDDSTAIGNGKGGFTLSGNELQNISSRTVSVSNRRNGDILVDGVTESDIDNIDFFHIDSRGDLNFENNASTFNSLYASAKGDISVKTDLTMKGYSSSFYTFDKRSKFYLASGNTISHESFGSTDLAGGDFDIDGNIKTTGLQLGLIYSNSLGFGKANCGGRCVSQLDNSELSNISAKRMTVRDSTNRVSIYFDGVTKEAFSNIGELTFHGMPRQYKNFKQSNMIFTGDTTFMPRGKIDRNANILVDSQVNAKDLQWSVSNINFTKDGKISASQNASLSTNKWAKGKQGKITMHENSVIESPRVNLSAKQDITLGLVDGTANSNISPRINLSSRKGSILDGDQDGKLDINAENGHLRVSTPKDFGTNQNPIEVIAGTTDFSGVKGKVGTKLNSKNGVNILKSANFTESTSIDADTDRDGKGTFKVFSQATVSTSDKPLNITAGEVALQGKLNSGSAKTAITLTNKGKTGIGGTNCNGPCASSIKNKELNNITASELKISTAGKTFVNGVSRQASSKSNLNAIKGENKNDIVVAGKASSFKNILIETKGNIDIKAPVSASSKLELNANNVEFSAKGKASAETVNVQARENKKSLGGAITQAPKSSIIGKLDSGSTKTVITLTNKGKTGIKGGNKNDIVVAGKASSFKNILIETKENIDIKAPVSARSKLALNANNVEFSEKGKATAETVSVQARENKKSLGGSLIQAPKSSINGKNVSLKADNNIVLAKVNILPSANNGGSATLVSNKGDIVNGLDSGINIKAPKGKLNIQKAKNLGSRDKAIEVLARKLNIKDPSKYNLINIINRINENKTEQKIVGFGASAEKIAVNNFSTSPRPQDPTNGGAFIEDPAGLLGSKEEPFSTIGLP